MKLPIVLLSFMFAAQVLAAELTVEECVRLGLEQNEELKAVGAEVEINKQDANIAYAELFPSIRLESSYLVRDQAPHFTLKSGLFGQGLPPDDADVKGEKEHYSVAVKITQPLYTGGRLSSTYQKQTLLAEAQDYQRQDHVTRLSYQIKKSFYRALTRRQELAAMDASEQIHAEELRILKELALVGKTTNDEVMAAESNLLLAKAEKLIAEQANQNALDDLSILIGMDEPFSIKEPTLYTTLSPEFKISHVDTLDQRNDLKRLDAQIHAADEGIVTARSGYYPQVSLEASYLAQRETDITEGDVWEAGLRLDWSLFEAGKTNAEIARAKAESLRLKYIRKNRERSAVNEANAALRLVRSNELLVEARRLQLLAMDQEYSHCLEFQYVGKKQVLEVLRSKAKLTTANSTYRAAINQLRTSQFALETALAVSIEDKLIPQEIYQPALRQGVEITAEREPELPSKHSPAPQGTSIYPYSIQLGSFRSEAFARTFMDELNKKHPERTFERVAINGWLKIRATRFTSRSAAEKALAVFDGKGIIVHANPDDTRTD